MPVLIRTPSQLHRALITGCALCAAAALALAFQGQRLGDGTCTLSFAFSPSAWAALAGAAIFAVLAMVMKRTGFAPGARPLGRFLWALSGAAVLAALALVYFYPFPSGTLYELHEVLHGNWQDSFGSSRLQIWRETLALIPEHPLLGGGPDTLALRLDIEFSRYVPETGQTMSTFVDNAHNEYLGILVNEGALGLAAYLAALVLTLIPWLRRKDVPRLLPVLGCGLAAYWVQSFFGLGLCLTAPLLWIFWGLAQTRPPLEPLSAPAGGKAPSSRKNKPKTAR